MEHRPVLRQIANTPFNVTILELPPRNEPNNGGEQPQPQPQQPTAAGHPGGSPHFVPLCLPMPNYIQDFESFFNERKFADLKFVFGSGEVIFAHKVVLARAIPMRNFLLLQGDSLDTITLPAGFDFTCVANFLQGFYHDGDAVSVGRLGLSLLEAEYVQLLFGQADSRGFIPCRPLSTHFPSLVGTKRFADGVWLSQSGSAFPVHRLLLAVRSGYFRRAFEAGLEETFSRQVHLPDVTDEIGRLVFKFLYFDADTEYLSPDVVLEMLYTADRFQLDELKALCVEEICRGVQEGAVDAENVLPILEAATVLNVAELREACVRLAITDFMRLQQREEFLSMDTGLKNELRLLASLQSNPLRVGTIARTKEILAMLKESLEGQEVRLAQVKEEHLATQQTREEDEGTITPEVREGRQVFMRHWEVLIASQEQRVFNLRGYIERHEKIMDWS